MVKGRLVGNDGGAIGIRAALQIEPSAVGSFEDFAVIYQKG
jgi:hypothetical protein